MEITKAIKKTDSGFSLARLVPWSREGWSFGNVNDTHLNICEPYIPYPTSIIVDMGKLELII